MPVFLSSYHLLSIIYHLSINLSSIIYLSSSISSLVCTIYVYFLCISFFIFIICLSLIIYPPSVYYLSVYYLCTYSSFYLSFLPYIHSSIYVSIKLCIYMSSISHLSIYNLSRYMHTHLIPIQILLSTYFWDVLSSSLGFVSMAISIRVFCCYPFQVPFFHIAEKHCFVPITQYKVSRAISGAVELYRVETLCSQLSKFMKYYHPGMTHDKNQWPK